jgi:hypothetical protein
VFLLVLAGASADLCAQAESRPAFRRAPRPPSPAAASRPVIQPTDADRAVAGKLGLPVEATLEVRAARSLTNEEMLALPPDRIERALKKLRNPQPGHPLEWMEWRLMAWRDENGQVPPNALMTAKEELEALAPAEAAGGLAVTSWTELGPGDIGGRVRSIAVHPTTPTTLFCGSVGGGIWKSVNGGSTWSVVNDFMGTLSISSIVFTPGSPDVMYAGTGESFAGDGLRGAGIFKSTDGGVTWNQLAATANASFHYVNDLSFSADGATLLAATDSGIWRSVNGGASFTNALGGTGNQGSRDVKFHGSNPLVAIADIFDYDFGASTWFHALAFSVDGGATFTESPGTRSNSSSARIETAWHRGFTGAGNGCAYAMRNSGNGALFRTVDGGATWTQVSSPAILNGTGWYYNALWVDPSDTDANTGDDVVLSGGLDLWRSTNGGTSFTKITSWSSWPASPHADQHVIVEDPGFDGATNRRIFLGNDGGVWKTENVYTAAQLSGWTNLNTQLAITQAYGASRCPVDGAIEMGTQDNGTLRYTPAGGFLGWTTTFGGDGGFCASDPGNPTTNYGEYVRGQIFRSTNSGGSGSYIDGKHWNGSTYVWKSAPYRITDVQNGFANFIAPFVMDPNAPTRIFVGCRSLWRTSDATAPLTSTTGPAWANVKAPTAGNSNVSAIAVAPSDSNVVWVGHGNGDVYSTADGLAAAPTWVARDLGSPALPNRMVTRITIDPANASRVLVTFGGFNTNNLWQTTDGGATWTAATGMPAVPLRDVEIGIVNPAWLYAASELGILISENDGASWVASTDGPARVSIDEMFWSQGHLYLATHGRGMFRATSHPASAGVVGTGCQTGLVPPLPAAPTFSMTPPVLGGTTVLTVAGAPYPAPGLVFASNIPAAPTPIGGGCTAYLDLATYWSGGMIPTSPGGGGTLNVPVPSTVALAGFQLAVQVVFLPAGGGFALTNGCNLTCGY